MVAGLSVKPENSDSYKAFVRDQYMGIKNDDSIEAKEQRIEAKKNIMANHATADDTKYDLRHEIAELQAEVDAAKLKEKYDRSADTFEFSSAKNAENADKTEAPKEKSSFWKKLATGYASKVVPGLGQAINGQWGKAAAFAIGGPIATLAAFAVNPLLGVAVGAGIGIANMVDAYKNA